MRKTDLSPKTLGRRDFFKYVKLRTIQAVKLGIGVTLLSACGGENLKPAPAPVKTSSIPLTPLVLAPERPVATIDTEMQKVLRLPTWAEFREYVDFLDPLYRSFILENAGFLFDTSPSTTILNNIVPVLSRSLKGDYQSQSEIVSGLETLRTSKNLATPPKKYEIANNTTVNIPIPPFMIPEILQPKVIQMSFPKGVSIYDGLSPEIILSLPDMAHAKSQNKDWYEALRKYIGLKEVMSLAITVAAIKDIGKRMQDIGSPTKLTTTTGEEVGILTQISTNFLNNGGRYQWFTDMGGVVAVVRGLRHDKSFLDLVGSRYKPQGDAIKAVRDSTQIPDSQGDLLEHLISYMISHREVCNNLSPVFGDFGKILKIDNHVIYDAPPRSIVNQGTYDEIPFRARKFHLYDRK